MSYHYKYLTDKDEPLTNCPSCGNSLTNQEYLGVDITLSVASHVFTVASHLDENGDLIDRDRAVENGYHSMTTCAHCGHNLDDYETCEVK
jgi:hypothetical protein